MSATPPPAPDEAARVSTLELFFDLVFVFTITQLTTVLFADPTGRGLLRVALMLGVIWYMYGGYAWLTNAVAPDRAGRRLLLLGGMAAFLVLALAIPQAFAGGGAVFGLAYLAVVAVHAALFTRAASGGVVRAILRLAPFNLTSALLVLLAGTLGGAAEYVVWVLALALMWLAGRVASTGSFGGFEIAPAHFVERHGLVVLIALGESVVAVGTGALRRPVDAPLAGVTVLGLLLNACLWWAYFGGDDGRAERALDEAARARCPALALMAFGYWHLPLLLGVIAVASALREATGHAFGPRRGAGVRVGWWSLSFPVRGGALPSLTGDRAGVVARRDGRAGPRDDPAGDRRRGRGANRRASRAAGCGLRGRVRGNHKGA